MNRRQHSLIYHTHRTMGVCIALALFAVCLSGTLTVLRSEIEAWSLSSLMLRESNSKSLPNVDRFPVSIDQAIATFEERHTLEQKDQWAIFLPSDQLRAYKLLVFEKDPQTKVRRLTHAYLHADTGNYLGVPGRELGDFIFQFHGNFSVRTKVGRTIVGLFGLCFLVMIGTGLILHRHLFRDLFKLRLAGSRRRFFADSHKFAGTWFLAFHLLIGTTGTIIALKDLLLIVPAFTVYRGDLKQAKKELRTPPLTSTGQKKTMRSIETMIDMASTAVPEFSPTLITVQGWGDQASEVAVSGSLSGELLGKNEAVSLRYSGANGKLLRRHDGRDTGLWQRSFGALSPLHYGDFGGLPVKLVYLFGGMTTLVLIWSGLLIWLERQTGKRLNVHMQSPPTKPETTAKDV